MKLASLCRWVRACLWKEVRIHEIIYSFKCIPVLLKAPHELDNLFWLYNTSAEELLVMLSLFVYPVRSDTLSNSSSLSHDIARHFVNAVRRSKDIVLVFDAAWLDKTPTRRSKNIVLEFSVAFVGNVGELSRNEQSQQKYFSTDLSLSLSLFLHRYYFRLFFSLIYLPSLEAFLLFSLLWKNL